jgi:hypothetical protein
MEQKIPQVVLDGLKEKFLNRKVRVQYINRSGHEDFIQGECTFIGINSHIPSWGLQVTVNRMPITNVAINNISLV